MMENEGFGFPWIACFSQSLCIDFPFYRWVFPKIGVPQNAWSIMENSLKWMIWGYTYFWKHPDIGEPTWTSDLPLLHPFSHRINWVNAYGKSMPW